MDDAWGDPRNYDPNAPDPYEDWYVPEPLPPVQPAVDPRYNVPPGNNQWGIPVPSPNPESYDRDLSYWLQNGVAPTGPDGIFDENGQVRPGWARTARGYERVGDVNAAPPPPPIYGGGGGGGGDAFGGFAAAGRPSYTAPTYLNPGPFDPGPKFSYRDFVAPTAESMLQEPGFQFRLDQGRKALEASAAGKGVLRSGGTLKDILGYGQNFASQEYNNVYNRALQEYDTNRGNAADIWSKAYGQNRDVYDARANNMSNQNTFNLGNARNLFDADFGVWSKTGDWLSNLE